MWMDEGLDTGDILLQERVAIAPEDDTATLGARLAEIGGDLLVRTVDALAAGTLERRRQSDANATIAPKLVPGDRRLAWTEEAAALERRVRALAPEPGALTRFRGRSLKVLRARVRANASGAEPATIVPADGLVVAAGRGALELLEVSPEGRRRMAGAAFARGARIAPGERMG